jgi:rhodanese-related sulfurtransferase
MNKLEFLAKFLSLYISHHEVLRDMESNKNKYVIIDVRNAAKEVKKQKIKSYIEILAKDRKNQLSDLSKEKIYVVYDWTGGTTLGKEASLNLYKNNYELARTLERWKDMKLLFFLCFY